MQGMTRNTRLDYFNVYLNGQAIEPEMANAITRISVDTNLHLPGMFEVHLLDRLQSGQLKWIDSTALKIGAPVKISATPMRLLDQTQSHEPVVLIVGEITALECAFDETGSALLVVRGYDKSHRLHFGTKTATYANMTDSAIVKKVADNLSIDVQAAPTTVVHEYVLQSNITDMAFLRTRAQRVGFDLLVDEQGKLIFRKASQPTGEGATLEWGKDLQLFRPRVSAIGQTGQVTVNGWDIKGKNTFQGTQALPSKIEQGGSSLGVDLAAAREMAGRATKDILTDQAALTPPEADALAKSIADEIQNEFVEADGTCVGRPNLRAGRTATISGVGRKFSGTYLVTSATHSYTAQTGYVTEFHISGRTPDTFAHLIQSDPSSVQRTYGVVIGVVTNNNDPMNLGRVKVKFPWLGNSPEIESAWCRLSVPMAGAQRGLCFIPEVNDEVLVTFEHGDVNAPYVIGALWNSVDKPPLPSNELVKTVRSCNGYSIHAVVTKSSSMTPKARRRSQLWINRAIHSSLMP